MQPIIIEYGWLLWHILQTKEMIDNYQAPQLDHVPTVEEVARFI